MALPRTRQSWNVASYREVELPPVFFRSSQQPRTIAIGNYDFRASGTVSRSIQIATAAMEAGLPVELWAIRAAGPLLDRVPTSLPVIEIGSPGVNLPGRGLDLTLNIATLANAFHLRIPAVFLSGGNHLHVPARLALMMSRKRKAIRFGARASNSSHRGKRSPETVNRNNRLKFGKADFVVGVSHALSDELREARLPAEVETIPNGVDVEHVQAMADAPFDHPFLHDRSSPLMVTMGRIARQKGFDIAIRMLTEIPGRLLIIGDGSAEKLDKLKALATAQGVAERVAFLGYQSNPFAILRRADLFVSASRWEGASNTLIEALACGLPLVATDCPTGNREVIERGPYGTLAPIEDPQALADAVRMELGAGRSRAAQAEGAAHWSLATCLNLWVRKLEEEYRIALLNAD